MHGAHAEHKRIYHLNIERMNVVRHNHRALAAQSRNVFFADYFYAVHRFQISAQKYVRHAAVQKFKKTESFSLVVEFIRRVIDFALFTAQLTHVFFLLGRLLQLPVRRFSHISSAWWSVGTLILRI